MRTSREFDPVQVRESFLAHDGYLIRFINEVPRHPLKPMGEVARNRLQNTVRCWLAGLDKPVATALPRHCASLARAIASNERDGGPHEAYRVSLHCAHALARWMLDGHASKASWASAANGELADWRSNDRPFDAGTFAERKLEDYLAFCIQARQFEAGLAEAQRRVTGWPARLTDPLRPREFAYAVCRHHARGDHTPADLFRAGQRMLQRHLGDAWLSRGQVLHAAMWLKIVYWDALHDGTPASTPLQTVMRAYAHLPGVMAPASVELEAA